MSAVDCLIYGQGPIALTLIHLLRSSPYRITWLAPEPHPQPTNRLYALQPCAQKLLETAGVWENLRAQASPYDTLQIWHGAPPTPLTLHAGDVPCDTLGYMVPEQALLEALRQDLEMEPSIIAPQKPTNQDGAWHIGEHTGTTLILAGGRHCALSQALTLTEQTYDYQQTAVCGWLDLDQPLARPTQWFEGQEILGILPYFGRKAAFVWSAPTARAEQLLELDEATLLTHLQSQTQGRLGPAHMHGPCQAFPLVERRFKESPPPGIIALGDAAHVVHPMAGLGLNLGLGDLATLHTCMHTNDTLTCWRAPSAESATDLAERYHQKRLPELRAWMNSIHGLQRTLTHISEPLQRLSGWGIRLIDSQRFLKAHIMAVATGDRPLLPPALQQAHHHLMEFLS